MVSHGEGPAGSAKPLSRRRWPHAAILGAICVAILLGLFAKFPWDRVAVAAASVPLAFIALSFASEASTILLKALRWVLLLGRAPGAARAYLVGQAVNQVAPTGTGEATRIYVGKARSGIPVKATLTAIVVERVADTGLLVLVTALAAGVALFPRSSWPVLVVPVAILSGAVAVLLRPSLLAALARLAARFRLPERPFREVQEAVEALRTRRTALGSVLFLTPVAWALEAGALWVLLLGVGIPLPFATAFLYTCVAELVGAFSFLPGGIGAREWAIALLFSGEFGIQAAAAALLFRLVATSSLAAGALGSLATYPKTASAGA
ncbi:MAG: lysylphosphatidylglycerol synthase transmembrane domain-containing protein [Halobacteria archaeon]